jgi:hypothetical protein
MQPTVDAFHSEKEPKYHRQFVQYLASQPELQPLSLAVSGDPAAHVADHISVLEAFMQPLVGLYCQALPPGKWPSDKDIRSQTIEVAWDIAVAVTDQVRYSLLRAESG